MDIIPGIATAFSSVKSITDILKAFDGLRLSKEVSNAVIQLQKHVIELQAALMDAQAQQSALISENDNLLKKLKTAGDWNIEKQRYRLHNPHPGVFVYALKESMKKEEPPHWICAKCYENGVKSILSPINITRYCVYVCPACDIHISTKSRIPLKTEYI